MTRIVSQYKGKRFNEPNDVVVKSDGTVWFTDPAYLNPMVQSGNYVYRFQFVYDRILRVCACLSKMQWGPQIRG